MNAESREVCAFAVDADTERSMREALGANKDGGVRRGDMAAVIKHLTGAPSPRVVIVDLDGSRFPAGRIHELAGVCEFGTKVIALGSNDTARLARELLSAGVVDYLPKPVSARDIREALAMALDGDGDASRLHAGRVVAFAGCGGSGATTLATMAARTSAAHGSYVSALDLGRTFGALPWMLDVEPAAGLDELLDIATPGRPLNLEMLESVSVAAGPRISVYGYRQADGMPAVPGAEAVRWLIETMANHSHLVIVDGVGDTDLLYSVLEHADERILVYEPTLVSLNRLTHTLVRIGEGRHTIVVENHTRARKSALNPRQIRHALAGRAPDVTIPFEAKLPAATNRGNPYGSLGKGTRAAVDRLVDKLTRRAISLAEVPGARPA